MPNDCRIQFYFKREELLNLLLANPNAKGVIISEQISQEIPSGTSKSFNVVHITARMDNGTEVDGMPTDPGAEGILGCPYPPGCTV